MADNIFKNIWNKTRAFVLRSAKPGAEHLQVQLTKGEKTVVFIGAYLIALTMWFIVNLNGTFNVTVKMPIELAGLPSDKALTDNLPEYVEVDLTGTAFPLIGIYNNPPKVPISVDAKSVNLFNQIRQKMSSVQEIEVTKVDPMLIQVNLENRITKKIPVILPVDVAFTSRHGFISEPMLTPDSIEVSGAESQIRGLNEWVIQDTLKLKSVKKDINSVIALENTNPLVHTNVNEVKYSAEVSEFTESEVNILIKAKDIPRGESIVFNPASVTIKYDVPLKYYSEVASLRPYEVYVPYDKIKNDQTGFVSPDIELTATEYYLKLRNFQPKVVAYFSVLDTN